MSGHSKWSKIKRQKGANDAKRGQIFTKLGGAIALAAKNGGDPGMNPSLALAIEKAKVANMPNANIEKSIKRGTGELGGDIITEMLFEGYGPGGVGIIVEMASDNRNRATTDVKTAFAKNGGNMAETGSVAFQFARKGVITVKPGADKDTDMLTILECGVEDVIDSDDEMVVYTDLKDLHAVRTKIAEAGLEIIDDEPQYVPNELIKITDKNEAEKIIKLMDVIEEVSDVTNTYSNFDIDDGLLDS